MTLREVNGVHLNGDAANGVTNGSAADVDQDKHLHLDAVIVGAGFSGICSLHHLRKLGLKAKIFEQGNEIGGVWHWNRYPGARVDSESPLYMFHIPELWNKFKYKERFPDAKELRRYLNYASDTLELKKDVYFHSKVIHAQFNKATGRWTVKTNAGHTATAKYLVMCVGLLHNSYTPDIAGMGDFRGDIYHSSNWPKDYSVKGKKVALIGAGATAVQITQEVAKEADHLDVYIRKISFCLPMHQREYREDEYLQYKAYYHSFFAASKKSRVGFPVQGPNCGVFDVTPEEREEHWELGWASGAANFGLSQYNDVLINPEANRLAYDFWAKKIRARMTDPKKRDFMAPLEPPYYYGTSRSPLEGDYYESLDRPNVDIIDVRNQGWRFNETGITTDDGISREYDVVILATGFDSFTGSFTHMGLKNVDGVDMKELWEGGIHTYLGMFAHGFPNMFMICAPQAPTAFTNNPTLMECQWDLLEDVVRKMQDDKIKYIEPILEAEEGWRHKVTSATDGTLFPYTRTWWNGGNIAGKKVENMTS
ncbi:hypothetical protein AYO20_08903 [Fonsecaea nubica]|uniref:FAD/NAD(P)-binding domain-containing protein n=1 Tax=Fonsecaea nubica TaxID=856822 RepID=A0A178CJE8_9EURO|nr:hypothetical protein AYO20_08903 [Fonsecaea nubica]OAL30100.1 hypothetical protein AYO20_08903 [Fonsecaea nubica]